MLYYAILYYTILSEPGGRDERVRGDVFTTYEIRGENCTTSYQLAG